MKFLKVGKNDRDLETYEADQRSNELDLEADVSACCFLVGYTDFGNCRLAKPTWFFLLLPHVML